MEVDRLSELKAEVKIDVNDTKDTKDAKDAKAPPPTSSKAKSEINEHMKLYDPIKESLKRIQEAVAEVEKLRDRDRKIANEKERKEIMSQMEKIMLATNKDATLIKKQLETIKQDNDKYAKDHKDSAKMQMRTNLYSTHIRRFHSIMNDYNTASHELKQSIQERTRRQLKIVDKNITDEEVEKIVESGTATDVIKQALISEDLEDVVRDIEERHQDILKLEKQVQEVFELFRDLAALVELQQDSLDVIETRVANAKNYTEQGEKELIQAEHYQKKARNKQCIILGLLVGVAVVVIFPVLKSVGAFS